MQRYPVTHPLFFRSGSPSFKFPGPEYRCLPLAVAASTSPATSLSLNSTHVGPALLGVLAVAPAAAPAPFASAARTSHRASRRARSRHRLVPRALLLLLQGIQGRRLRRRRGGKTRCGAAVGTEGSAASAGYWYNQELDLTLQQRMRWVQRKYMIYNYCTDPKRIAQGLPIECSMQQ
ncbi:unnamed protein product [Urochloa humidicola]